MYVLEELEQVVLSILDPLTDEGVKTLELYDGQAEADDVKELAKINVLFPCLWVIATSLSNITKNTNDDQKIGVLLIIGDKNLRGVDLAKTGSDTNIGVYKILKLSQNLLHRKNIRASGDVTISGTMRLKKVAPMFLAPKRGLCFYSSMYEFETIN